MKITARTLKDGFLYRFYKDNEMFDFLYISFKEIENSNNIFNKKLEMIKKYSNI